MGDVCDGGDLMMMRIMGGLIIAQSAKLNATVNYWLMNAIYHTVEPLLASPFTHIEAAPFFFRKGTHVKPCLTETHTRPH